MHHFYSKIIVLCLVWLCAAQSCRKGDSGAAERIAERLMMPEGRKRDAQILVHDMEQALSSRWPGTRVVLYGSLITGMAQRDSDVDVHLTNEHEAPANLHQIHSELAQHPALFSNFILDDDDSDPVAVIKLKHIPTGFYVDLNLNSYEGILNSQFVGYYIGSGCKQHLTLLLRQWARGSGICRRGVLPSYGMALLVIFYLQQKNILPPLSKLQKNAKPLLIDNWNMAFDKVPLESRIDESLYEILGGFFEFYEDFDFEENIVSTFVAHPVKRQLFEDLRTVPNVYSLYVHNVESNTTSPLDVGSTVCIQDVFQHNKNVGEHLDRSTGFQDQIKLAALKYRENNESVFLEDIFISKPNTFRLGY